ncbi:MAG: hypothetical protein GXY13_09120 [Acidimicrobiales bacterium]|mgnify:CR=1 FL=1|nr:hypothetical protein [Acidimicrobiales bacterium]
MTPLLATALGVAVVAAARSTWSPCGLSMLSTITPMAERARGHRYGVTATWFVVGAALGGLTLGAVAALVAVGVGALGLSTTAVATIAAVLAGTAAAVDAGTFGRRPPFFRRQVDDAWLSTYRAWVYGGGFGWQIGVGFATYIMTAGVALTALLAALTGSPAAALLVGVVFGTARGLVVLLGAGLRSPAALGALHARLDSLEAPVRWGVTVAWAAVAVGAAAVAGGPVAAAVTALAMVAAVGIAIPLAPRVAPS